MNLAKSGKRRSLLHTFLFLFKFDFKNVSPNKFKAGVWKIVAHMKENIACSWHPDESHNIFLSHLLFAQEWSGGGVGGGGGARFG